MASAFSESYQQILAGCRDSEPNVIDRTMNELGDLFPGSTGYPHQLTDHNLTLDDVVLTIASVWLGLRQIKYPFRISMGQPDFYHRDGAGDWELDVLPKHADAFVFPVDITDLEPGAGKRKRSGSGEVSQAKRQETGKLSGGRNIALAICEPNNQDFTDFSIDIRSLRAAGSFSTQSQYVEAIVAKFKRSLVAAQWHSPPGVTEEYNFNLREVLGTATNTEKAPHCAILHAWAYLLDLPIKDDAALAGNGGVNEQFFAEALKLFNLALSGQLSYALLQVFLEESGYVYPTAEALPYYCVPQEKYRRHLREFRSVEVRQDSVTTFEAELKRLLARPTKDPADERFEYTSMTLNDFGLQRVEQAIGTLWRATFKPAFPYQTESGGYAFYNHERKVAAPNPDATPKKNPLFMVHKVRGTKSQQRNFTIFSVANFAKPLSPKSAAEARSPLGTSFLVHIAHFGVDKTVVDENDLHEASEETVRQCAWHNNSNVNDVRFIHRIANSPATKHAPTSAIYAVLLAWAKLLDADIVDHHKRDPETLIQPFINNAIRLINFAFQGRASLAAIEAFLVENGICMETRSRVQVSKSQPRLHTCDQLTAKVKTKSPEAKKNKQAGETSAGPEHDLAAFIREHWQESARLILPDEATEIFDEGQSQLLGVTQTKPKSRSASTETPLKQPSSSKPSPSKALPPKSSPEQGSSPKKTPVQQGNAPPLTPGPPRPLQLVPVIAPYRDEHLFTYYDASEHNDRPPRAQDDPKAKAADLSKDLDAWAKELARHIDICNARATARKQSDEELSLTPFSDHNKQSILEGTDMEHVGKAIASLWEPLWDRSIKYGFVHALWSNTLCEKDWARNAGVGSAAGGPFEFIIPAYTSLDCPSPGPDFQPSGMGHIWFAVARLRNPQPSEPPQPSTFVSPDLGKMKGGRRGNEKQITAEWKNFHAGQKRQPVHVDLYIYDSLRDKVGAGIPNRRVQKSQNMVRYSGWAVGADLEKEGNQTSIRPRYWHPSIEVHHVPCPQQTHSSFTGRKNTCGMFTIMNAWATMLDLTPRPAQNRHQGTLPAAQFWSTAFELFDLALLGCLSTRTIQAFFNAYGYLETVQELRETVVDAWTVENGNSYGQKIDSIVQEAIEVMESQSQIQGIPQIDGAADAESEESEAP